MGAPAAASGGGTFPALDRAVFTAANLSVLPAWAGMILAPRAAVTRRLVATATPVTSVLAAIYAVLLFRGLRRGGGLANFLDPEEVRRFLTRPEALAPAWIHYLVLDLLVGRTIWQRATNEDRTARVATTLAFVAGPVGYLVDELGGHVRRRRS